MRMRFSGPRRSGVPHSVLDRTLLPVSQVDDFDDLAIPYRAVAAEIATGDTVVLSEGSLSRSVRATRCSSPRR